MKKAPRKTKLVPRNELEDSEEDDSRSLLVPRITSVKSMQSFESIHENKPRIFIQKFRRPKQPLTSQNYTKIVNSSTSPPLSPCQPAQKCVQTLKLVTPEVPLPPHFQEEEVQTNSQNEHNEMIVKGVNPKGPELAIQVECENLPLLENPNTLTTDIEIKKEYDSDTELNKVVAKEEVMDFSNIKAKIKTEDFDIEDQLTSYYVVQTAKDRLATILKVIQFKQTKFMEEKRINIRSYRCNACNRFWDEDGKFALHLSVVHKELNNLNIITDYIGDEYYLVFTGTNNTETPKNTDAPKNTCDECGTIFSAAILLKQHNSGVKKCNGCLHSFVSCLDLKNHLQKCVHIAKVNDDQVLCKCGQRLKNTAAFEKHSKTCMQDTTMVIYVCSICQVLYRTEKQLDTHLSVVHVPRSDEAFPVKLSRCSLCLGRFVGSRALHYCPKRPNWFKCQFCNEGFQTVLFRAVHQKAMKKEVSYCERCNAVFTRECVKNCHKCQVNRLAMYVCEICNTSYLQREHVVKHIKNNHGYKLKEIDRVVRMVFLVVDDQSKVTKDTKLIDLMQINENFSKENVHISQDNDDTSEDVDIMNDDENSQNEDYVIKNEVQNKEVQNEQCKEIPQANDTTLDILKPKEKCLTNVEIKKEIEDTYEDLLLKVFHPTGSRNVSEIKGIKLDTVIKEEPIDEEYEDDIIQLDTDKLIIAEGGPEGHLLKSDTEKVIIAEEVPEDHLLKSDYDTEELITVDEVPADHLLKSDYDKEKVIMSYERKHKCRGCGMVSSGRAYTEHLGMCKFRRKKAANRKKNGRYKCALCLITYNTYPIYLAHWQFHVGFSPNQCPYCRAIVRHKYVWHLSNHIRGNYRRVFYMDAKNSDCKAITCRICNENVVKTDMVEHYEVHVHEKSVYQNPDSRITVPKSDASILSSEKLKETLELITSPLRVTTKLCNICNKRFTRGNDMKRHLIEHVLENAYMKKVDGQLQCPICAGTYNEELLFKEHMREHSNLPLYKCTLCDKTFSDSSNFAKHRKVHNLHSMTCDLCHRKFHSKQMLIKHVQMHAKLEPVKCKYCRKVFYFYSTYKKHMKLLHEKSKPNYLCKICKKRFTSLKNKWDHCWIVHDERKIKADCTACSARFRKFSDLRTHMLNIHKMRIHR